MGKEEKTKSGTGLCPIMSNGQNVAVPCKGDKCQLWDDDRCSQKATGYLIGICDEVVEIRKELHEIVKVLSSLHEIISKGRHF